jgi:hypothetical protein
MNQRVTVALIGGESGKVIQKLVRRWKKQRVRDTGDSESWVLPSDIRREVRTFTRALHDNSEYPPVLFYRQYVDQWSMGDVFGLVGRGKSRPAVIHLSDGELYAYSLPDRGALLKQLRKERRRSPRSVGRPEKLWFIDAIRDAVSASQARKDGSTLIVVRNVVGGLVDDDEISAAMGRTAGWLRRPVPARPAGEGD